MMKRRNVEIEAKVNTGRLLHIKVGCEYYDEGDKMWLEDNGVSENSVRLTIYRNGGWDILATEKTDEDEKKADKK